MPYRRRQASAVSRLDRDFIGTLAPFKSMGECELNAVLQAAQHRRITTNQAVFHQGDPAEHFYCLVHGHLKVVQVTSEGQQVVVRIVHPGELFGVARALSRTDYPGTALAVVECTALAWRSTHWDEMTRCYPTMALAAMHTVGWNLQDAHARIRELSTEDVEHRIAHTLARLVTRAGRQTREGIVIDFPISQQDIAEMTGTTLFTVSRVLGAWESIGLVSRGRRRLLVHDQHRLQALADGRGCGAK
jgi:CRP/FNR family transcriptional regulator, nitrogen oxide reductase regulator